MRHRSAGVAGTYGALWAAELEQFARLEAWGMVGPRHRHRLDAFEAGRPVVVPVWLLPGDGLSGFRGDHRNDQVQVDPDGRLTLMRPIVFIGHHPRTDDPTSRPQRHQVAEEAAPNGDTAERLIGLAELAGYVNDVEDWQAPLSW